MSKKILFQKVGERIIAVANANPLLAKDEDKIKDVKLWNSQLDNEEREEAVAYPMVYLEFIEVDWLPVALGYQKGNVLLGVHVVTEKYPTDDREYLDIVDAVYASLQGYSEDDCFGQLIRTLDTQDTDHDNCIDWVINFTTVLIDSTASQTKDRVDVVDPALEINSELDIDNNSVRTGDGDFTP